MTAAIKQRRACRAASFGLVLAVLLGSPALSQTASDYTSYFRSDVMGRPEMKIGPDPDGAGPRPRRAEKSSYYDDGRLRQVQVGTTTQTTGSDFVAVQTTTYQYDDVGNKILETTPAGVTQVSYDANNRPTCTAIRMDPNLYGSLPTDACAMSSVTAGPFGPDQISRKVYDAAGQVTILQRGVGTSLQQDWSTTTYTANGKIWTTKDANGNVSTYKYDGFDRLIRLELPSKALGAGVSNTADYEAYTYDANGNRKTLRKRDNQTFAFDYDALNRLIVKHHPTDATQDVHTEYDLMGRVLAARFGSATGAGVVSTYDKAGRRETETTHGIMVGSQYDKAGNRTRVTWSDGFHVIYDYDNAGLLTRLREPSGQGLANDQLAGFDYDGLGRRIQASAANGVVAAPAYDAAGRLASLHQGGFANGQTLWQDYAYSPASQITELTQNNPNVVWTGQPTITTSKAYNGLNQDGAIAALNGGACGAAGGYDCNGNLLRDGTRVFTYDAENRLTGVTGASSLSIAYDPLGRILTTTAGATTTRFVHDGDRLIGEYAASELLTPVRRYAHGVGTDEPLVWYEGSNRSDRRWLHADRQGSIIGVSYLGGSLTTYAYGPYGEVQTWEGSRFRYTGQIALPEAAIFHYKARVYDPATGRFLQTDPVGYEDGLNMYAYVGNDPVNKTDPTGTTTFNLGFGATFVTPVSGDTEEVGVFVSLDKGKLDMGLYRTYSDQLRGAALSAGPSVGWQKGGVEDLKGLNKTTSTQLGIGLSRSTPVDNDAKTSGSSTDLGKGPGLGLPRDLDMKGKAASNARIGVGYSKGIAATQVISTRETAAALKVKADGFLNQVAGAVKGLSCNAQKNCQ